MPASTITRLLHPQLGHAPYRPVGPMSAPLEPKNPPPLAITGPRVPRTRDRCVRSGRRVRDRAFTSEQVLRQTAAETGSAAEVADVADVLLRHRAGDLPGAEQLLHRLVEREHPLVAAGLDVVVDALDLPRPDRARDQ